MPVNSSWISMPTVLRFFAWALCALPLLVAGQNIRSAHTARLAAEGGRQRAESDHIHADHARHLSESEIDKEWEDARKFLSLHAPNRLKHIEAASGDPSEQSKRYLVLRYRSLVRLQKESPALYDTRIHEVELEDQVFGICLQMKHAPGDRQRLQAELHRKIAALVALGLDERQQRIGLLESELTQQKRELENDKTHKDQLIENRFQIVSTEGVLGARFNPGHPGTKSRSPSTSSSLGATESEKDSPAP